MIKGYLPKDQGVRYGEEWEWPSLTDAHIQYAALDTFVLFQVYQEALKTPVPIKVTIDTPRRTNVTLMSGDGTQPIALAMTADQEQLLRHNSITVKTPTNSRVLVEVQKVLMPNAGALLYVPN